MKFNSLTLGLAVAAMGLGAWLFFNGKSPVRPYSPSPEVPDAASVASLYATKLPDAAGRLQALEQWRGKTLVVNYWATWCYPCREEMPMFSKLHDRYAQRGVQFVGIALDDAEKVGAFARETTVSYPLLVGGHDAINPTRNFGNTPLGVPFTIILDREGKVHESKLGRVREDALTHLLDGLVQGR